jgi:hypothetical protein
MNNLESISKSISGRVAGLLIAKLSRYGFHPQPVVVDAVGVILTAIVGLIVLTFAFPIGKHLY